MNRGINGKGLLGNFGRFRWDCYCGLFVVVKSNRLHFIVMLMD